jgi:hypothetical protein
MVYKTCIVNVHVAWFDTHVSRRVYVADGWARGIIVAQPELHGAVVLLLVMNHWDRPIQDYEHGLCAIIFHCTRPGKIRTVNV